MALRKTPPRKASARRNKAELFEPDARTATARRKPRRCRARVTFCRVDFAARRSRIRAAPCGVGVLAAEGGRAVLEKCRRLSGRVTRGGAHFLLSAFVHGFSAL